MHVEIGGLIEEEHKDGNGNRVIDRVSVTHLALVPNENGDIVMPEYTHIAGAFGFGPGTEIELNTEMLEEFEELIDESAPPERHWTSDDWRDWFMGR